MLADMRLVWRVINYLQRDVVLKGVLKHKDDDLPDSKISSFWYNMDDFMPAARQNRLYVVLDSCCRLIAYFIVRHSLEHDGSGTLPVDIFEVLPRFRKKGVGSFIVSWLEDKALIAGFDSLKVFPVNDSKRFWIKKGFSSWGDSNGFLLLQIA